MESLLMKELNLIITSRLLLQAVKISAIVTLLSLIVVTRISAASQATTIVSVASDGTQANNISFDSGISADNLYVVFSSPANNLVAGDNNGAWDVFVRELLTERTIRVSIASDGTEGNSSRGSLHTAVSADGRYITFMSYASNLVTGDTNATSSNNGRDVFVRDRDTDGDGIYDEPGAVSTIRVSLSSTDNEGNKGSDSDDPDITPDGRFVAFNSSASNLVPGDMNGVWDTFVRDRDSDEDGIFDEPGAVSTNRVSISSVGIEGNDRSLFPSISADGRYIAFMSFASNLVTGDTNGVLDAFVHDRDSDEDGIFDESGAVTTIRISVSSEGFQANGDNHWETAISSNGRYVVFESAASNLVTGDTNGVRDVFVRDRDSDEDGVFDEPGAVATIRVSMSSEGMQANGESSNSDGSISDDGRYVTFESFASNLVSGDTNGVWDGFVHDLLESETTRISIASDGTQGNLNSTRPKISPDSRYIGFTSAASNLVPVDTNNKQDVFIHDRGPATQLVEIDIKPGSDPNCFNINGHGVIPVAILGTDNFDVTEIDLTSLSFGGLEVRVRGNKGPLCSVEYSNDDTYLDLVCHFDDDASNWIAGDSEATLTGNLLDGTPIEGTDSICVGP